MVLFFATKLSALPNSFSNLKCTLSWNSNSVGVGQNVVINTTFGNMNSGVYNIPFHASMITIMVETTISPNSNNVIFSLKRGSQIVMPLSSSPNTNPYNQSMVTQPTPIVIVWALPISLFQNNSGILVEANTIGPYPGSPGSITTGNFSGTVSTTVPPLVLSGPTFQGNPCILGNNFIAINATGGGGNGTYNCSYSFNNVPYVTNCMNCLMGNTKGMGNYSVTITSAGLTETKTFTIDQTNCTALNVTNSVIANAICTTSNGSAKVSATGGTGVYSYVWKDAAGQPLSPAQTTATATNLAGNTSYTCETTSGTAIKNSTILIPQSNNAITTTIKSKPYVKGTRYDGNTIEVYVNNVKATGANYTFLWSTGATTASIDLGYKLAPQNNAINQNLHCVGCPPPLPQTPSPTPAPAPTTTYSVTVKDANGCTATGTYVF